MSKLLLFVGKESLEWARWGFFSADLKLEVAVKTSEMKFQPLLTTDSGFPELDLLSESADSAESNRFSVLYWRFLEVGPYSVVVGGLVGGITNSISLWLL